MIFLFSFVCAYLDLNFTLPYSVIPRHKLKCARRRAGGCLVAFPNPMMAGSAACQGAQGLIFKKRI